MPSPRRSDVDDFLAQLTGGQRPHLQRLRELSLAEAPRAREQLKWNLPTYVTGDNTNLWMLQAFTRHCSLRFTPAFYAGQQAAVRDAGFDGGAGFIRLPYDRELPTGLLEQLMRARIADVGQDGAATDEG